MMAELTGIDVLFITGALVIFLIPLLIGYAGFGSVNQRRPWFKKSLVGMAIFQLLVLLFFAWVFGTSHRQLNHLKWFAPLVFVDILMWLCLALGLVIAAVRTYLSGKFRKNKPQEMA